MIRVNNNRSSLSQSFLRDGSKDQIPKERASQFDYGLSLEAKGIGMYQTNQFDSDTQKQVPYEQFNFSFDLWAKAVRQQMLEALQTPSAVIEADEADENLLDSLDDESE